MDFIGLRNNSPGFDHRTDVFDEGNEGERLDYQLHACSTVGCLQACKPASLQACPGSRNVIPGEVRMPLDFRHLEPARLGSMIAGVVAGDAGGFGCHRGWKAGGLKCRRALKKNQRTSQTRILNRHPVEPLN